MLKNLTENISVLPASSNPLSADVGIVYGRERVYLYDVGANEYSMNYINGIDKKKSVILSHFHKDHMGNIGLINCNTVYGGRETIKHLPDNIFREGIKHPSDSIGTIQNICVTESVHIDDGVHIEIVPIPSTHAKGSLAMCVNEEYTFLGDATYTAMIKGQTCYNAQLLKSQIEVLDSLKSRYFLLSHDEQFVYEKQEIIGSLKNIYDSRDKSGNKSSNYILMEPVKLH